MIGISSGTNFTAMFYENLALIKISDIGCVRHFSRTDV